eukprot:GHRQ01016667.1.p2 GENE.GHRQ01016667.1~~GHRQ01016667.1.p2  ORF type:complete len:250 (+),score=95.53 GHRQ01016667.1:562-1311(+)
MLSCLVRRSISSIIKRTAAQRNRARMATDAGSPSSSMPTPAAAIDFLMLLERLKTTKRTGWVRCNVQQPESIADHMYRMGMMSLLASDAGVDAGRCMRMALVHDVAEALVGDITPHCNVSDEQKYKLEADAIQQIKQMLGEHTYAAQEVDQLWQEYEQQSTPEAHLVKDFDKLEMIMQAHEYEQSQGLGLQQFFDSTRGRFRTDTGRAWAEELVLRRQQAAAGAAAGSTEVEIAAEAGADKQPPKAPLL